METHPLPLRISVFGRRFLGRQLERVRTVV